MLIGLTGPSGAKKTLTAKPSNALTASCASVPASRSSPACAWAQRQKAIKAKATIDSSSGDKDMIRAPVDRQMTNCFGMT